VLTVLVSGIGVAVVQVAHHVLPAEAQQPAFVITRNQAVRFTGVGDDPVFVLVIGTDDRPGVGGARADAIHLIGINPARNETTFINIPRDTWVQFPGGGFRKINEGNTLGGLDLQTQVVSELVGVPISFTVQTNFEGFVNLVNALGGIEVDVPFAMRDGNSGASFNPGLQLLDGDAALALSRNRNIPAGDLQRSANQALVLLGALAKVQASQPDVSETLRLVRIFMEHSQLHNTTAVDLVHLARMVQGLDLDRSRSEVIPATTGSAGGASVVFVLDEAEGLFADFRDNAVLDTWGITFGGGG
jgi:LCP family protein required for cell wall assembly